MNAPPRVAQLLAAEPAVAKRELDRLAPEELLAPSKIVSSDDALLVKAALYLHHGFLGESHTISQQVATPSGSYWHGIMHRAEGDLDNSRYWYHRVGPHPVLQQIGGYPQDKPAERREFDLLLEHTIHTATTGGTTT